MSSVTSPKDLMMRRRAILIACFLVMFCRRVDHPPDALLLERFGRDRAIFERIVEVFKNDGSIVIIDADGIRRAWEGPASTPIRNASWHQHWADLERIGVKSAGPRAGGTILLIVSERDHDTVKGYEYSLTPLRPAVSSLDAVKLKCQQDSHYRVIANGWYLALHSVCS